MATGMEKRGKGMWDWWDHPEVDRGRRKGREWLPGRSWVWLELPGPKMKSLWGEWFQFGNVVSLIYLWSDQVRLSRWHYSRVGGTELVAWAGGWELEPWMNGVSPEYSMASAEQRAHIDLQGYRHPVGKWSSREELGRRQPWRSGHSMPSVPALHFRWHFPSPVGCDIQCWLRFVYKIMWTMTFLTSLLATEISVFTTRFSTILQMEVASAKWGICYKRCGLHTSLHHLTE